MKNLTYPIIIVFLIILVLYLIPNRCSTSHNVNVTQRDSVVVNVKYRDTTIYNVIKRDSVITDYRLVSVTEFDTVVLHDTTYISIPIASYRFTDSISDIYASGYRVTLARGSLPSAPSRQCQSSSASQGRRLELTLALISACLSPTAWVLPAWGTTSLWPIGCQDPRNNLSTKRNEL